MYTNSDSGQTSLIIHPFQPVYNSQSRILILGSFPSQASRTQQFYYGHPQNRFWPLIASLLQRQQPRTITEKKELLYYHGIALYDAVSACTINKSEDASIDAVHPSNLDAIFQAADIQAVFTNGSKAYEICTKHMGIAAVKLPSTSPANARFRFTDLEHAWKDILRYI
ncbi:MAG: DNA-deoxyinosine glycosylase [Treponema sp.]